MGEVAAVAKFLQHISSLLAEPSLATWRARKQVEAQRILALGEAEVAEIREVGEARASAKAMLELAGASQSLLAQMGSEIDQRIESHFDKRLNNLAQIVARAERALPPGQVPDVEPDMAWTSSFSNAAQDISDEDMQEMWARVLAGEVEKPGSTSVRTLGVLRGLDQLMAQKFKRLCSIAVSLSLGENHGVDHRLVSLGGNFSGDSWQGFGIRYADLLDLSEYGLIVSEFMTQGDYRVGIWGRGNLVPGRALAGTLGFQGQKWALVTDDEWDFNQEFWVPGAALTKAGRELSKVVELAPVPKYAEALKGYFAEKGLDMVQV